MIFIRGIDSAEIEGDHTTILDSRERFVANTSFNPDGPIDEPYIKVETIRGVTFRRPDGTEVVIGASKEAQDIIGIQYEAWHELEGQYKNQCIQRSFAERANKKLIFDNEPLIKTNTALINASLMASIGWIFTGVN